MDEQDQWLTLYIILFFAAFISGLALLAARSQRRRQNAYEPWHARLAAAEGKPRDDGIIISKTSTAWVSGVLLSVVALTAIVAWAIFFWRGWPDNIDPQVSATLRGIRAGQQQTTSGTKTINDSHAAEDPLASAPQRKNAELAEQLKETQAQMAQDNASVAEKAAQTHGDNASAAEKLEKSREHTAGVLAKDSEEDLRPQTPLPQPNPTACYPEAQAGRHEELVLILEFRVEAVGGSSTVPRRLWGLCTLHDRADQGWSEAAQPDRGTSWFGAVQVGAVAGMMAGVVAGAAGDVGRSIIPSSLCRFDSASSYAVQPETQAAA